MQPASALESTTGNMKSDGNLRRNWLNGALDDAMHAVFCSAAHKTQLVINKLKSCRPTIPLLKSRIVDAGLFS
jgi:hypothetical protein